MNISFGDIIQWFIKIILHIIYIIYTITFLFELKGLNKSLEGYAPNEDFREIMSYNDNQSWKFLGTTILLLVVGFILIYISFKFHYFFFEDIIPSVMVFVCICIIVILMISLLKEINVPILMAAVFMIGSVGIIGRVATH